MKRIIAILLTLIMLLPAAALCENATPAEATPAEATPAELQEGEMYFHGYRGEIGRYYVGMPEEWAPVGINSPAEYISQAEENTDYFTVRDILSSISETNDVLIALSPTGEVMTLTYGFSEGTSNETLIDELDNYKKQLAANHPGIQFTEDSGEFELNEINKILHVGATYMNHSIHQFYMPTGKQLFIFTFIDVKPEIAKAVMSTFQLLSEGE